MTTLYSPTAILHEGKICLKYWDSPEYQLPEEPDRIDLYAHTDWLNSAKIVPFAEQDETGFEELYEAWDGTNCPDQLMDRQSFSVALNSGIPLDSIADRLEIVEGCEVPECTNPHTCNPVAIIKPIPITDPHADLIDLVVKSFGKSIGEVIEIIKEKFKIERR